MLYKVSLKCVHSSKLFTNYGDPVFPSLGWTDTDICDVWYVTPVTSLVYIKWTQGYVRHPNKRFLGNGTIAKSRLTNCFSYDHHALHLDKKSPF
jgi:hypothetical protein